MRDNASIIGWRDVAETMAGMERNERIKSELTLKPIYDKRRGCWVMRLSVTVSPMRGNRAGAEKPRSNYTDYPAYSKQSMASWALQALNQLTQGWVLEPEGCD